MPTSAGQNAHEDENLVTGWTVQGGGQGQAAATGVPGAGYAQAANVAATTALTTTGQAGAGVPNPPLAFDVSGENSAAYAESILTNPGYADVSPVLVTPGALPAGLVPFPASGTAFTNPTALSAAVVITGGTVSQVTVNGVNVGAGDGMFTVPGAGTIRLTYTGTPAWAWTTV